MSSIGRSPAARTWALPSVPGLRQLLLPRGHDPGMEQSLRFFRKTKALTPWAQRRQHGGAHAHTTHVYVSDVHRERERPTPRAQPRSPSRIPKASCKDELSFQRKCDHFLKAERVQRSKFTFSEHRATRDGFLPCPAGTWVRPCPWL